jgi:hypothetical protein
MAAHPSNSLFHSYTEPHLATDNELIVVALIQRRGLMKPRDIQIGRLQCWSARTGRRAWVFVVLRPWYVLPCNNTVSVYHKQLFLEQQKAGSTGLDIASVFELRNAGVFGTAAGDLLSGIGLGSAAWSLVHNAGADQRLVQLIPGLELFPLGRLVVCEHLQDVLHEPPSRRGLVRPKSVKPALNGLPRDVGRFQRGNAAAV